MLRLANKYKTGWKWERLTQNVFLFPAPKLFAGNRFSPTVSCSIWAFFPAMFPTVLLIQSSQCFPTMPKTLFSCFSEPYSTLKRCAKYKPSQLCLFCFFPRTERFAQHSFTFCFKASSTMIDHNL